MKPLISLVLSTYNNATSLELSLLQLAAQQIVDPNQVEFIIVNNNSSDRTNSVIEHMDFGVFHHQYFTETRQGLSHARNKGVENAQGDYILFTDDDAELSLDWIQNYLNHLKENPVDCVFGKIEVIWDKPKPWWYDERYKGYFAVIDHGNEAFKVTSSRYPFYGKNFCVKKTIINEVGGFDPRLGRKGNDLTGGEECVIFDYLLKKNGSIWYYPDITVGHRLKDREYTQENIARQHIACAKPIVILSYNAIGKKIFGRNLITLKNHLVFIVEYGYAFFKAWRHNNRKEMFFLQLEIFRAFKVIWNWIIKIQ
jgi:glycosyltransferase involved in cell wall biosynthesis